MFWLQSPPWGRWALAALIVATALWIELRPDATVSHPFAIEHIARGDAIDASNTDLRTVPVGLLETVPDGAVAARGIPAGAPVLLSDVGSGEELVPEGWWVISLEVPAGAQRGDRVRVVVVDTGMTVEGIVASEPSLDPLTGSPGSVALPADGAGEVAAAAFDGRVAVLVAAG